ncbi:hypothetical protein STEG23_033259, partial [Scotinomys teguina]
MDLDLRPYENVLDLMPYENVLDLRPYENVLDLMPYENVLDLRPYENVLDLRHYENVLEHNRIMTHDESSFTVPPSTGLRPRAPERKQRYILRVIRAMSASVPHGSPVGPCAHTVSELSTVYSAIIMAAHRGVHSAFCLNHHEKQWVIVLQLASAVTFSIEEKLVL